MNDNKLKLEDVRNIKTLQNIEKLNIDVSQFTNLKDLRAYITKQKKKTKFVDETKVDPNRIPYQLKKTIEKHNIDLSQFATRGELNKFLCKLNFNTYYEKNKEKVNKYYLDKYYERSNKKHEEIIKKIEANQIKQT